MAVLLPGIGGLNYDNNFRSIYWRISCHELSHTFTSNGNHYGYLHCNSYYLSLFFSKGRTMKIFTISAIISFLFAIVMFMGMQLFPPAPKPAVSPIPDPTPGTAPLVIFVPGLNLHASDYQAIISILKDNGYAVRVYEPTFQDPTNYPLIVHTWENGMQKLIGEQQVYVIGHSIGGAVAVDYCAHNKQCLAGVNMDGTPLGYVKMPVPFLYLQADAGRYCTKECQQGRLVMSRITSPTQLHNLKHYNFTDAALALSPQLHMQDYLGGIDGKVGLEEIDTNLVQFLNKQKRITVPTTTISESVQMGF